MLDSYLNFQSTPWTREFMYRTVSLSLGIPGLGINGFIIYRLLRKNCPLKKPFKYVLCRNVYFNLMFAFVLTILFQPLPFADKLSLACLGLASVIPYEIVTPLLCSLTLYYLAQIIASIDLCAMFRYYAIRGYKESRIIYLKRFIYDAITGYVYGILLEILIFLHRTEIDKDLIILLQKDEIYDKLPTLSTFKLHHILTQFTFCLALMGIFHSVIPNIMIFFYIRKHINKHKITSGISKEQLLDINNMILLNTLLPYTSLFVPAWYFVITFISSGFKYNAIMESDYFVLITLGIVYSWPTLNACFVLALIKLS